MNVSQNGSVINIKTSVGEYPVYITENAVSNITKYIPVSNSQRALIVTDSGVPAEYAYTVSQQIANSVIITIPQGEENKNIQNLQLLLTAMVENNFTRTDCIIAVGGGVVGDLAGFAASMFMRGIDVYNIPTTVLAQVDSSVGGKTAVDFMGIKNIIGAFYPPKAVVIDVSVLKTLPQRQISNGLSEVVKMALTCDKELFEKIENSNPFENLQEIITRAVLIKKSVVEADEKESGLRRVLNFGHTIAHGIETANEMREFYHGECVAMGMVPMCSKTVKERLIPVLKKLNLPCDFVSQNTDKVISALSHDKKMQGNKITVVYVSKIGEFEFVTMPINEFEQTVRKAIS